MGKVLRILDLAGGMPYKGAGDLIFFNAAAVVGDTDHGDPAIPDLDGDRRRTRVNRILHQLFDDVQGSLNDLSRRNPADRFLCEESDFHNMIL